MTRAVRLILPALLPAALLAMLPLSRAAGPDPAVLAAEQARVAVVAKVRPAVLAVCFFGGEACGSGVVISPDGYALTNYHVVEPTGAVLQCGMPDGRLYDAVVVGQDRVGDVALIKLLPREPGKPFPFAVLGDSDRVKAGDFSFAMGNPFGLSLDFTPTVTFGLVSGVNRYQPPEGRGTLEYTDCIQIDTSINPGNSGGPLFSATGELIGINGRGSFEKRGRVNSGVGYAISINQIKNFLGHLHAGYDCDHASLGATVETEAEDGDLSRMVVRQILDDADAARRGVQPGDQVVSFAGRPLLSVNQYKNVLGIYPKEWRLPLSYRRGAETKDVLVRLAGVLDPEPMAGDGDKPKAPPRPKKGPPEKAGKNKSAANKLVEAKPGFANYHFNREQQASLKAATRPWADFAAKPGAWGASGQIELADRRGDVKLAWADGADGLTTVSLSRGGIEDAVTPLRSGVPSGELLLPQGSGGLLGALYQWRRLLTKWDAGFEGGFDHGGHEPCYPPGRPDATFKDRRVDCEVLRTRHGPFEAKWYFDLKTHKLIACESVLDKEADPCELFFGDYKPVDGKELPHTVTARVGDRQYAVLRLSGYQTGK